MSINTVAILSPGDMGHAVGQFLREHGLRVITCLTARSVRTRALAEKAAIIDIPVFNDMVAQSDVILSITTSEAAPQVCQQVAEALWATGSQVLFAECNAIAPQTVRRLEPIITTAGGRFVDASILGYPPKNGSSPKFYACGPHAGEFNQMREFGLDVRTLGPEIGRASSIKMCNAAMTKGSAALYVELLMAAELMGVLDELKAQFQNNQAVYQWMERWVQRTPANARRYVSEMQEIEATFAHLGLTPHIFAGVVDMYRFIGSTPLGDETPETEDKSRTLQETIRQLTASLQPESD